MREEPLADRRYQVPPSQLEDLEYTGDRPPPSYSRLDDCVDVGGCGDASLDEPESLSQERPLKPHGGEAGHLLLENDRLLADPYQEVHDRLDRFGRAAFRANDLDEGQEVGRVGVVGGQYLVWPAGRDREVAGHQARRSRGQDGVRRAQPVELREDLPFQVDVLEDVLHHQVHAVDGVGEGYAGPDVLGGPSRLVFVQRAHRAQPLDVVPDAVHRPGETLFAAGSHPHVVACHGELLRDGVAHDAGAYYRDAVYLVGCGHSEIGLPALYPRN